MPLHPSGRSWEISRDQVTVIKVIGKGAFSQVAQATARDMRGKRENITVAVKMLKGKIPLIIFTILNFYYLVIACRTDVIFSRPSRRARLALRTRLRVLRVLRLFGQRLVARKDSGVLEFYYPRISAVKQCKPLRGSQSIEFSRISPGAHSLTKKPEDSGCEKKNAKITPVLQANLFTTTI